MDIKRKQKERDMEEKLLEQNKETEEFMAELEEGGQQEDQEDFIPHLSLEMRKEQEQEVKVLVDTLLEERLGEEAWLVVRYLGRPGPKNNTIPVINTAKASLR